MDSSCDGLILTVNTEDNSEVRYSEKEVRMNLVFFDIDGTLAIRKDVPASAERALRELRNNGSVIFICTGRALPYVRKNFYKYANGFICNNGRLAVMGCCEHLYDEPLTKEEVTDIIAKLDSVQAGYAFFGEDAGWYGGAPEGFDVLSSVWDPGFIKPLKDVSKLKAYNFDVWVRDTDHRKQIEEVLKDTCLLNPHGPHPTADVTVIGKDKGTAIRAVAEKLNVPMSKTYAFGDGVNDICMIEAAGHGIAMGNAVQELKDKAEYVTADILDDGVMKGLQHFNLI